MNKILIMGLPGSGKTTLAKVLAEKLGATHINADALRTLHNDWDFSPEGRLRQAERMKQSAEIRSSYWTVSDFVAPTQEIRDIFNADYTVWVDTTSHSRYGDTDAIFEKPLMFDLRVTSQNAEHWAKVIYNDIRGL